jgi:hypothetical protein
MTKQEVLARLRAGQAAIPENLSTRTYVLECVAVMFDVVADVLAEGETK